MTSQTDISVELSAYLDGQLPSNVAKWVDRAVIENPEVARQLHDLRRVRTILRALEPAKPKQDFVAKVIAEAKRRGLMRHVARERMARGILRLASAAAAVLLIAVVAGVALQSFMRAPAPPGALSIANQQTPTVTAAEGENAPTASERAGIAGNEDRFAKGASGRPMPSAAPSPGKRAEVSARPSMKPNGKLYGKRRDGNGLRKHLGVALGRDNSHARTLKLSVADLGAGAKEVETVLASAGIVRTAGGAETIAKFADFDACGTETVAALRGRAATPEPAASTPPAPSSPSAKRAPSQREMFYRSPGGVDELRLVVVARPGHIAAVTKRLGDLRPRNHLNESASGLCAGELTRPEFSLPKAAPHSSQSARDEKPGPKSRPTTEPYHIAELQRLANNSQVMAWQRGTGTAPTSQVAQQAARQGNPGMKVLIITVRLHRPTTNRVDPVRNISQ